jgi:hypothetical protein
MAVDFDAKTKLVLIGPGTGKSHARIATSPCTPGIGSGTSSSPTWSRPARVVWLTTPSAKTINMLGRNRPLILDGIRFTALDGTGPAAVLRSLSRVRTPVHGLAIDTGRWLKLHLPSPSRFFGLSVQLGARDVWAYRSAAE